MKKPSAIRIHGTAQGYQSKTPSGPPLPFLEIKNQVYTVTIAVTKYFVVRSKECNDYETNVLQKKVYCVQRFYGSLRQTEAEVHDKKVKQKGVLLLLTHSLTTIPSKNVPVM